MDCLILRLDAPLMSFGGVIVDQHNITDYFPGTSLLTGLFANALGWNHGDADALDALQARLIIAARWDIEPEPLADYHTVDLGQPKMCKPGWTTHGQPEHRDGGPGAKLGTHIRHRHYWANGIATVAVTLADEAMPDLAALEAALRTPARPLFLGRKTCLPSAPILVGSVQAEDVLAALRDVPRALRPGHSSAKPMPARWPAQLGASHSAQIRAVYDQRNWRDQWHAGHRLVAEGPLPEATPCI